MVDPVLDIVLIVGAKLIWAPKLTQVVVKPSEKLPCALAVRSAVMYVPVFMMSPVLSSKLCHSNTGAVMLVAAIMRRFKGRCPWLVLCVALAGLRGQRMLADAPSGKCCSRLSSTDAKFG